MNRQTFNLTTVAVAMTLMGCVSAHAQAPALKPRVIQTQYPTEDIVVALAVATEVPFNAKADGTNDCTAAIQAAIDAVAKAGGGVVFLPEGRYLCKGNLLLRETVTLRGDWRSPEKDPKVVGTILMPTAGRNANGPAFIGMQAGSGIRDLSIWYPEQNPEAIVPYPWTLAATGFQSSAIYHVTLVNSYLGIVYDAPNELHMIRDLHGTPLKCGLDIDKCSDVGKLVHIRFRPDYWLGSGLMERTEKAETAVRQFLRKEATGMRMTYSDAENVYDMKIAGYAIGFHLLPKAWAVFYGAEAVEGGIGLLVDGRGSYHTTFTRCRFDGADAAVVDRVGCAYHSCTFGPEALTAVVFEGAETLSLQNCVFSGWIETGVSALRGPLAVQVCDFKKAGVAIRAAAGVPRALILGNTFVGQPGLDIQTRSDVHISHYNFRLPGPKEPAELPPDPRPATTKLFNVTDYGAKADVSRDSKTPFTDNTKAFQDALDAAGKAGGGTVYVPAGNYLFKGALSVPTGVELRGCFDVAHHTSSGGSVLMPTGGRGEESGTPFLRLAAKSGVRGLTFWYPEQSIKDVKPYPWTFQSTGPGCWLLDVSSGNACQVADFGSFPSEGHLIRCLWGAPLWKGLWVSKGSGTIDNCHFNPHFWGRPHKSYPEPDGAPVGNELSVIPYQQAHEEAYIFGRCPNTLQVNNFVYGSRTGLSFVDDAGGSGGVVINYQSDVVGESTVIDAASPGGLDIVGSSATACGSFRVRATNGVVRAFNTHLNGNFEVSGAAEVLIQQGYINSVIANAGRVTAQNLLTAEARVGTNAANVFLVGNANEGGDGIFRFNPGTNVRGFGNGGIRAEGFETGFDRGQPDPIVGTRSLIVGGVREVSCVVVPDAGRNGTAALVLSGQDGTPKPSLVYHPVFNVNLAVTPEMALRYWIKPDNELGRCIGIDFVLSDRGNLRDSAARDLDGRSLHPGQPKGPVGQWTKIESPIGKSLSGKIIRQIVLAYDEGSTTGPFKAAIDDLYIGVASNAQSVVVQAKPEGGSYPASLKVELVVSPKDGRVRYTLDGSMPVDSSPVYEKPIVFDKPGAYEVRFQVLDVSSNVVTPVFSRLYDVR